MLLWDVTDPARPRRLGDPLTGHTDAVSAVAFAPDGHTLATASVDKTVLLWDLSGLDALRADPMERACSVTGRGLNCRRVGPLRPRPGLRGLLLTVRPTAHAASLPRRVSGFR